jgi:hypothetical protein
MPAILSIRQGIDKRCFRTLRYGVERAMPTDIRNLEDQLDAVERDAQALVTGLE